MRLLFTVIFGMMLLSCRAWAQEEDYIGTATTALQDVLSNLEQSVEKLTLDNNQLAARDNAVKQQVMDLQAQLGSLEGQGDLLNKSAAQSRGDSPRRTQQIARLEEENSDLDNHIQKAQANIRIIQRSLDEPHPEFQAAAHNQKEELRLMKMIYDSQQRQVTLHEAIQKFQKNAPPVLPPADSQWDDSQLHQLEAELKVLEQNYAQLRDLMAQMNKKEKVSRMTVSQHIEEEKLQKSMDDLTRQGIGLRNDLDDLRSQMVDLDKRKSSLEMMIQH